MTPDPTDAALGALLGACVGDAAGATLEFLGRKPTARDVAHALTLPGGGAHRVAPGQITDDGELLLCLAQGLADRSVFSLEAIAVRYEAWMASEPFDVGGTTATAFGAPSRSGWRAVRERDGLASAMTEAAARSMDSKANGSLMRAAPLGVWGHSLPVDELAAYARRESALSHPNASCADAVACFDVAIASLVKAPGDRTAALATAEGWAERDACAEVRGWLDDARADVDVPYQPLDGFVRIAFTHAFRHLRLGTPYVDALAETLAGGGDTDTNACIVGALVGAASGASAIPAAMRDAVSSCRTELGRPRPAFLHPSQLPELVPRLLRRP